MINKNIYLILSLFTVILIFETSFAMYLPDALALTNPTTEGVSLTNPLTNPLGNVSSPQILIGRVINGILSVVGSLALVMFIYGGLLWMTSAGSNQRALV